MDSVELRPEIVREETDTLPWTITVASPGKIKMGPVTDVFEVQMPELQKNGGLGRTEVGHVEVGGLYFTS